MTITITPKDKHRIVSREKETVSIEMLDKTIKEGFIRSISSSGKYEIEILED